MGDKVVVTQIHRQKFQGNTRPKYYICKKIERRMQL